jgi:uncharacterized membrane protein
MQCPVCSKEVDPQSSFCASCGAPIAATAPPTPGYTTVPNAAPSAAYTNVPNAGPGAGYTGAPAQPMYPQQPMAMNAGLSDNVAAALSYVTIIPAIIFLVLEPYNKVPLIRFHSWQSIFLFIGAVVLQFAVTMLHVMMHFIPLIWILFALIHFVLGIGLFILWIIAILKASKGEWYKIPVIGDFAEKQARGM